jgi:hypothetical protein
MKIIFSRLSIIKMRNMKFIFYILKNDAVGAEIIENLKKPQPVKLGTYFGWLFLSFPKEVEGGIKVELNSAIFRFFGKLFLHWHLS